MAREFWIKKELAEPPRPGSRYPSALEHSPVNGYIHVREVMPNEPDYKKLAAELAEALSDSLNGVNRSTSFEILAKYRAATEGDK